LALAVAPVWGRGGRLAWMALRSTSAVQTLVWRIGWRPPVLREAAGFEADFPVAMKVLM